MAQVPTPAASRQGSESPEVELSKTPINDTSAELSQVLDTLLERYLHLLDRHQTLQAELGKQLSSGFFSLAHANYTCPPGRWYGADYYDERMKATRKVSLHTSSHLQQNGSQSGINDHAGASDSIYTFTIESVHSNSLNEQSGQVEGNEENEQNQSDTLSSGKEKPKSEESSVIEQPTDSSDSPEQAGPESTEPAKPKGPRKKFQSNDPITWFGILVPLSLRSAQTSFTKAIEGQIPELASVNSEMQVVEKEVERLRNRLDQV